MFTREHILALQDDETFMLYAILVEGLQIKELEFDESRNPRVLEEIKLLRRLIDKALELIVTNTASNSMN